MAATEKLVKEVEVSMDPWETGELGRSDEHVGVSSAELEKEVDLALELQMISVRLPQHLIKDLKFIADYRAIGYQPLIRDVLLRWVRLEMSQIAHELKERVEVKATIEAAGLPTKKAACG